VNFAASSISSQVGLSAKSPVTLGMLHSRRVAIQEIDGGPGVSL
jgi:hypothetical protein